MNLQDLQRNFEEWYGEPHYVLTVAAPNQEAIPNRLDILYYFGEEVEKYPTDLATIGLASRRMNTLCEYAELMIDIAIGQSRQDYETLGKGFADLVWSCLRRGLSFSPNLVIWDVSLPLFEKMNCLFVMDWWGDEDPQWLLDIEPNVRVLKVIPIYESEAAQLDKLDLTTRTRVFENAIVNPSDPQREPVSLLTEATKEIWKRFEAWCRKNAPNVCEDFREGASVAEIQTLEERIGMSLPEEFAAYLMVQNGEMWFDSYEYLSTERIYQHWLDMKEILENGYFDNLEVEDASKTIIKNTWWDIHWIPFACDSGGNRICIDLNPDVNGRVGQVIYWEKHEGLLPTNCLSFFAWFAHLEKGLGTYFIVDKEGAIREKLVEEAKYF